MARKSVLGLSIIVAILAVANFSSASPSPILGSFLGGLLGALGLGSNPKPATPTCPQPPPEFCNADQKAKCISNCDDRFVANITISPECGCPTDQKCCSRLPATYCIDGHACTAGPCGSNHELTNVFCGNGNFCCQTASTN